MGRFYFSIRDGNTVEKVQCELSGIEAARRVASRLAGELLRDHPLAVWSTGAWHVEVTNDSGLMLFAIDVIATETPGAGAS